MIEKRTYARIGLMVHYLSWGARMGIFAWTIIGVSMSIVKLIDQCPRQIADVGSQTYREPNEGEQAADVVRS